MLSCSRLASLLALTLTAATHAYIPAQPGYSGSLSRAAPQEELHLGIQWYPQIFLIGPIRRQALGSAHSVNEAIPPLRGAVIQFTENGLGGGSTLTPWIALVSCDATTDASADVDIFSLAYERGAVAMVLYSITADCCVLNPGWNDSSTDQATSLDVYTTLSREVAGLMQFQFHATTDQSYSVFDSALLNLSFPFVKDAILYGQPGAAMGYPLGTLWTGNVNATYEGGWLAELMAESKTTPPEIIAVIVAASVLSACAFMAIVWTFAKGHQLSIQRTQHRKAGTLNLSHGDTPETASTRYHTLPALPFHSPHDSPVHDAASPPAPSNTTAAIHTHETADKRSAVTTLAGDTGSGIAPSTTPPSYHTSHTAAPSYHTRRLSHHFQPTNNMRPHELPASGLGSQPGASTDTALQVIKKDRRPRKGAANATAVALNQEPASHPLVLQCASASFADSTRSEDNTGAAQNPPSESAAEMDASRRRSRVRFAPLEHVSESSDLSS